MNDDRALDELIRAGLTDDARYGGEPDLAAARVRFQRRHSAKAEPAGRRKRMVSRFPLAQLAVAASVTGLVGGVAYLEGVTPGRHAAQATPQPAAQAPSMRSAPPAPTTPKAPASPTTPSVPVGVASADGSVQVSEESPVRFLPADPARYAADVAGTGYAGSAFGNPWPDPPPEVHLPNPGEVHLPSFGEPRGSGATGVLGVGSPGGQLIPIRIECGYVMADGRVWVLLRWPAPGFVEVAAVASAEAPVPRCP